MKSIAIKVACIAMIDIKKGTDASEEAPFEAMMGQEGPPRRQ